MPAFHLNIITPQGTPYSGDIEHCLIPAENGFVGILANHAPYVTASSGGRVEIREVGGATQKFQVGAGFFEVASNQATFLTQSFLR